MKSIAQYEMMMKFIMFTSFVIGQIERDPTVVTAEWAKKALLEAGLILPSDKDTNDFIDRTAKVLSPVLQKLFVGAVASALSDVQGTA